MKSLLVASFKEFSLMQEPTQAQYLQSSSRQRLCDALAEYRGISTEHQMQELAIRREYIKDPQHQEAIVAIDLAFVLFGCPKNHFGSLQLLYWIIFSTSGGWKMAMKIYSSYFKHYQRKKSDTWRGFLIFFGSSLKLWKTFFQAIDTKKKWPIYGYHPYLNCSLDEVREEFGIGI